MSWTPILTGADAWGTLRDIADALATRDTPAADLALFWSYFSAAQPDDETEQRAAHALEAFGTALATEPPRLRLFGGLVGQAWIAAHVADDVGGLLAVVDTALRSALSSARWAYDYDLISGLVGFGVYLRSRDDAAGLARVIDHLGRLAERGDAGTTWHTRADLLPAHLRASYPDGVYNVGLAHGTPGIVALLARICGAPDAPPGATALRDDAVRWVLAQRLGDAGFPDLIGDRPPSPSRTAWCYGDPGVSLALWAVALHGGSAPAELDAITERWMARTPEEARAMDAGLCHGTVGLAHICNRLYQATRRPAYRDAALRWLSHTLALRRPGEGIAGFRAYRNGWTTDAGFLEGVAGIGLALLAALTPVEPEWDALMLCDLPVSPSSSSA